MRRKIAMAAVFVLAVAVSAFAQKTDFSGSWTPDTDAAAAPAGGGGGRMGGGPMMVKQTATELSVERQGRNGAQTQTYKLDGTESDVQMGQMTAKVSAKWDGDKLVITTKTDQGESTQTWSLADGKLTIARTGGRGPSSTTYKKAS